MEKKKTKNPQTKKTKNNISTLTHLFTFPLLLLVVIVGRGGVNNINNNNNNSCSSSCTRTNTPKKSHLLWQSGLLSTHCIPVLSVVFWEWVGGIMLSGYDI